MSPRARHSAMPMLAVTNISPSTRATGRAIAAASRSAIACDGVVGGPFAEDGELVTAEARDQVLGPDRAAQAVGDRDEELVARRVAQAVVDSLKRSRSRKSTAQPPVCSTRVRARARVGRTKSSRFGRPVSGSWIAWCARRSPLALRSVMSSIWLTACSGAPRPSRTSDALERDPHRMTVVMHEALLEPEARHLARKELPQGLRRRLAIRGVHQLDERMVQELAFDTAHDLDERAIHAEHPTVERRERHADRRVLERAAEPRFGLLQIGLGATAFAEIARREDHAVGRALGDQLRRAELERPPGALGVTHPAVGRLRVTGCPHDLGHRHHGIDVVEVDAREQL